MSQCTWLQAQTLFGFVTSPANRVFREGALFISSLVRFKKDEQDKSHVGLCFDPACSYVGA